MKFATRWLAVWLLCGPLLAAEPDLAEIPAETAKLQFATLEKEQIQPLNCGKSAKFAALIFITTDCPIANGLIPEMNRLDGWIEAQGGKLTLVHVDWDLSAENAAAHAHDFAISAAIVIDREHWLVRATGAKMTPEAVVIAPSGRIAYRGRINDLFTDYGDRRRVVAHHDLRDAISQFVAGKPVESPRVEALGCFIPDFPAKAAAP